MEEPRLKAIQTPPPHRTMWPTLWPGSLWASNLWGRDSGGDLLNHFGARRLVFRSVATATSKNVTFDVMK